jgi:hypothetical protein
MVGGLLRPAEEGDISREEKTILKMSVVLKSKKCWLYYVIFVKKKHLHLMYRISYPYFNLQTLCPGFYVTWVLLLIKNNPADFMAENQMWTCHFTCSYSVMHTILYFFLFI